MIDRTLPTFNEAQYQIKIKHFFDQGFEDINGVVHVGANDGYEVQWYLRVGIEKVLCFEPLPSAAKRFREVKYPQEIAEGKVMLFEFGLGEKNKRVPLHIAPSDGQGSSILLPQGVFRTTSPHRDIIDNPLGDVDIDIKTFETVLEENPQINPLDYNCLVVDTQGTELDVLKGFGKSLQNFKYLNIECSHPPVYEGEADGYEVAKWLKSQGFEQNSPMEIHNDVFFLKKTK